MKSTIKMRRTVGTESAETAARNAILGNFLKENGNKALKFAYKLSGNADDAANLVQDASYRVLQAWDRYDKSKPLEKWFFSILRNSFVDAQRRVKRQRWVALDAPVDGQAGRRHGDILADNSADLTESLEEAEAARAARMALRRLSSDYRAVIQLWEMNGMKYAAIAGSLGIPVGTVRSRLCRARRALRKQSAKLADFAS